MCIDKIIKNLLIPFLAVLCFSTPVYSTETVKVIAGDKSKDRAAGFIFTKPEAGKRSRGNSNVLPVIQYQQNIHMLSTVDDRLTFQVFADGRVLVHYPVYMKRAGDYEMQLEEAALIDLLHSLSDNGVMGFDSEKNKTRRRNEKKALNAKGQYFAISDVVETTVEVRLDEYQKNSSSKKISNFYKKFKWDNLEQDAKRFKNIKALDQTNRSVSEIKNLMKDARLVKKAGLK